MSLKLRHHNKYIFIFCSFFPVGLEDYLSFFEEYFSTFYYLGLKFPHSKDRKLFSFFEEYSNGKISDKRRLSNLAVYKGIFYFLTLPLNYMIYLLQIVGSCWGAKAHNKKPVIFMGINYFCTFGGIILKKLGRVDYVIYRVMDFFPLPPSGPYRFLNKIFYQFDKYCLKNSDFTWFTTEGHIIGREKYGYYDRTKSDYEMVPLAINIDKYNRYAKKGDSFRASLVYCGVISRYHQMDLIFEVIQNLKEDFSEMKLNLIGSGPDLDYYKDLAAKMNLEKNIEFFGFLEEGKKFFEVMRSSDLGIALYKDEENFMKYTEPAKAKYYLNFGLPLILSRVPKIADELEEAGVSFAVKNEAKDISDKIRRYFSDPALRQKTSKNIAAYVKTIEVKSLLEKRFDKLLYKLDNNNIN